MPKTEIKPGKDTTEFQVAKSASTLAKVGMVLSAVTLYAPQFCDKLDGKAAAIAAAIIGACSVGLELLTSLGYVKSRTILKKEAEKK